MMAEAFEKRKKKYIYRTASKYKPFVHQRTLLSDSTDNLQNERK
jgi:hypothetical protein